MHHESDCGVGTQVRSTAMIGFGAGFLAGGNDRVSDARGIAGTGLDGQGISETTGHDGFILYQRPCAYAELDIGRGYALVNIKKF